MGLDDLRKKIDLIDSEILRLLSERMFLSPEIARIKKASSEPVLQPGRVKEVLSSRRELAVFHGLDPVFVEKLFSLVIKESMRLQEK